MLKKYDSDIMNIAKNIIKWLLIFSSLSSNEFKISETVLEIEYLTLWAYCC